MPEARYWLCAPFSGHFIGANLMYSHYNAGGIKLSAAEPIGVVRVSYPRIYDAAQKEEGPSKVYVTNRCAHLYYRNGTSAQLFAGDGGEMTGR